MLLSTVHCGHLPPHIHVHLQIHTYSNIPTHHLFIVSYLSILLLLSLRPFLLSLFICVLLLLLLSLGPLLFLLLQVPSFFCLSMSESILLFSLLFFSHVAMLYPFSSLLFKSVPFILIFLSLGTLLIIL